MVGCYGRINIECGVLFAAKGRSSLSSWDISLLLTLVKHQINMSIRSQSGYSTTSKNDPYTYLVGFGNQFASEAL